MNYDDISQRPAVLRVLASLGPGTWPAEPKMDSRTMYDIGLSDVRPTKPDAAPNRLPRYF